MKELDTFQDRLITMRKTQQRIRTLCWLLATIAFTVCFIALYHFWLNPVPITVLQVCFLPGIIFLYLRKETLPNFNFSKLRLFFDMQHPNESSPFTAGDHISHYVEQELKYQIDLEKKTTQACIRKTLPIAFVFTLFAGGMFKYGHFQLSGLHLLIPTEVTLEVVEGHFTNFQDVILPLQSSTTPQMLETHKDNLFKLSITPFQGKDLSLNLIAPKSNQLIQSFQLQAVYENSQSPMGYGLEFTISEDTLLVIPELSSQPYASIQILSKPIPKVTLELQAEYIDPWPDHQAVPLKLKIKSQNPLQKVILEFSVNGQKHQEHIESFTTSTRTAEYDHALHLEPYLQDDMASVIIHAIAFDQTQPQSLMGSSDPVFLRVASAYGRYLQTLDKLRAIKKDVDQWVAEGEQKKNNQSLIKQMRDVAISSNDSPFFDGLDRIELNHIEHMISQTKTSSPSEALQVAKKIDSFLQDHEMLNDRERDRDFFVALRGLSRLIETPGHQNKKHIQSATKSLNTFLTERQKRWEQRVKKLKTPPPSWDHLQKNSFQSQLQKFSKNQHTSPSSRITTNTAIKTLSHLGQQYRRWLNELEGLEDKQKSQQEQKRQQGLASAKATLRELQQRQTKISTTLDQAETRQQKIDAQWPLTRMNQNSNIKLARKLTAQLQSLAPQAAQRLSAAHDSMLETIKYGGEKQYQAAETFADRAGRLLREAKKKTSQAQQKSHKRGRRRRISGDRYYGRSVSGGMDLHREYSVDRKYREDILDEVSRSEDQQSPEDASLLNSYLRQVIR
ncbi:MAG: hypothetical protein AB8C84_02440 [Oligoflexales bacterium]